MPIPTTIAQQERFHDLINLHLYLQVELFRGQTDRYRFHEADIEIARTGMTCPRTLIQRRLEPVRLIRRLARMEQRAIGGAGRGCVADRPLR